MSEPILSVRDLKTYFDTDRGLFKAVDGISFDVGAGKTVGLVGESGCGKSVTSLSIMGLIPMPPGRIDGGEIIFEGQDILNLGDVLPLSTEFWLSSMLSLGRSILEAPFPNKLLKLPYAKPTYALAYESLFDCPVLFDTDVMEWHFDAAVLNNPCPNANPITADLCKQFCEKWVSNFPDEDDLVRRIRTACINNKGHFPNADEVARRVGMSQRTLQRRLSDAGKPFHAILDEVRSSLAKEYLDSSTLTIAEVAERTGFSEPSSFRKAFIRWTGDSPSNYRLKALSNI